MKNDVAPYPVTLKIDLPGQELNRLTTAFRIFLLVPIAIVIGLLAGASTGWDWGHAGRPAWQTGVAAGGVLFLPALLMIVFRQKYPRWWFDWNVQFVRFSLRVAVYAALLTDVYPSTDEEQAVHLKVPYPDAKKDLSQWLPLVKWFLAIPHLFVLFFLGVAAAGLRGHLVVRDPLHRALPEGARGVRGGGHAVGRARVRLRLPARDGRLPALHAGLSRAGRCREGAAPGSFSRSSPRRRSRPRTRRRARARRRSTRNRTPARGWGSRC